ncbi:zeta toxin [Haloarcula virus HCTV-16]|nr:zeta toxin [Haloarcula virus HCTV-16]
MTDDLAEKAAKLVSFALEKEERVYIDNPSEAPDNVQVQEGDQGGTYYVAGDAEGSSSQEGDGNGGNGGEDEVEWVDTPHGEVPDTDGPIPPDMRNEPIGSDSHPVLWKRPDGEEELNDYISAIEDTEWYGEGSEIFERAFHGDDNTENQYTDEDGNWDEDRLEKHEEWSEELLNEDAATDEDEQPIGMILLGPPGAGKGWWQEQVEEGAYGETGEFVEREFTAISSDRTKEPIPEYNETNASEVHDEASKMAKENLAPAAIGDEHNVIVDKVATSPDSTLDMIESMREKGYDIRANFVNVPTEKAVHNAVSRYHEEGRFTPLEFVNGAGEDSRESFNTILDEGGIPDEKAGRFDNDVEWGNAPEAEYIGEELLKALLQALAKYKYTPDEERHGESNARTSRSRRDRRRDSGVDGGRLRRSGGRGNEGSDRGRRGIVALDDLVKEAEQIFVDNVHEAPEDSVVHVDPDDDAEERMYYVAEKAAEVVTEDFLKDWVSDPSDDAPNRWRNTETGEYRYQENKPGSDEGGEQEGESDGSVSDDVVVDDVQWNDMPGGTVVAFDTADGDWLSGDFEEYDDEGNAIVEGHEDGEEWVVSPDDATNVMLPEDQPDNDDEDEEDEEEQEVSGIDIDYDNFRRIAIGQLFEDESDKQDESYLEVDTEDGVEIRQIEDIVNDPAATFGDRQGYIELDDGSYMNLMGEVHENMPDDATEENTHAMTAADGLVPADPEPSGSEDVDDWNVDWGEVVFSNHGDETEDSGRDLRRLNRDQKRRFKNEWEEVASEEGIAEVTKTLQTIKGSTFNERGAHYDKLVMETFGIEGEPRSGVEARGGDREIDPEDVPDVSDEAVEAFEFFSAASQKFFRENYGDEAAIHRGMGEHAVKEMAPALAERIADESDEAITVRDNPAAVFTTDKGMSHSYDKGLVVSKNISSDEVFAMPEALLSMEQGPGPDWNEGEVNVNGWDQEISLDEVRADSTDTTYGELVDEPGRAILESDDDRVFSSLVNTVRRDPEAAHAVFRKLNNSPGAISSTIEERHPEDWSRLSAAAAEAVKQDDKADGVVDIRSEADWLSEAAEDAYDGDDEESDVKNKLMRKVVSWIPLASESSDPSRERVDEDWNEVEDEEELSYKASKVVWGNVGGDPFSDYDVLEEFCNALEEEGASVLLGDEPWEEASGHHDRSVRAFGITLEDAEDVWDDYKDESYGLTGPSSE